MGLRNKATMLVICVQVGLLSNTMATGAERGNTGREFILSSLLSTKARLQDHYFLISTTEEQVDVNVTVDLNYTDVQYKAFTVGSEQVTKISLLNDFSIKSSVKRPIIHINATGNIGVTVFISAFVSGASYLALPVDVLGKEYRLIPMCFTKMCSCAVVTTEQDTVLDIFYQGDEVQVSYDTVFVDRDPPNVKNHMRLKTLRTNDHIAIEGPNDFTGIYVTADAPLAVFCGWKRDSVIVAVEQLLPVEEYGMEFYPLPVVRSMPPSFVRVVVHYNCTRLTIGSIRRKMDGGKYEDFPLQRIGSAKIKADKPITAMQIFHKNSTSVIDSESAMVTLPSRNQYSMQFSLPRNVEKDHRLFIGILSLIDFNIQLQGKLANFYGTTSKGVFIQKDSDGATVTLKSAFGQPFVSYVYRKPYSGSHSKLDAYANPVGFNLTSRVKTVNIDLHVPACTIPVPTVPTKTSKTSSTAAVTTLLTSTTTKITDPSTSSSSVSTTTEPATTTASSAPTTSTTTSTTTTTATTTIAKTTQPCCPCVSDIPTTQGVSKGTTEKVNIEKKIQEIQEELRVDRSELSSTIRRKTSAEDERVSAKGIGLVGMSVMCGMIGFFVILDVPTIFHHLCHLWKNVFGRGIDGCRRKILRSTD